MPLSLEQYVTYLDSKSQPWPAPPPIDPPRAKPSLSHLRGIKAVLWTVYGTVLHLPDGELRQEHPVAFVMDAALDKTVQEFKMWGSMTRKPGAPGELVRQMYEKAVFEIRSSCKEAPPEVPSDRIWETIVKKLLQKSYQFDAGFFGSLNEFSRKVAYYFHACLQGTVAYPTAAAALSGLHEAGITQGVLADGQCFTLAQLERALKKQDSAWPGLGTLVEPGLQVLSYEARCRKPGETLFRLARERLDAAGLKPNEVLHVGSDLARDVAPAKKLGMRTALFAGDRQSLRATPEQLKDPATRPDVLLTELVQVTQVVS